MNDKPALDFLFSPRSVAVVTRSTGLGVFFFSMIRERNFGGALYPVCDDADELLGAPVYRSVRDIPGPVDYVIVSVSANHALKVIKDCIAKGVKAATLFTAGFSELGTEEGVEAERILADTAKEGNLRLIGPNCMGICCPRAGLYFSANLPSAPGWFGIASQSGGNAIYLAKIGPRRGTPVSKVVSYGNACDINESDLLEYFADDGETAVIGAYIEGVKDGMRFRNVLAAAARKKPTIVLKGGQTVAGAAVTQSHTASLSGSARIWDALVHESGVLSVESLDEMIDLALLFRYMKPPSGRRIGMVGIGGGISVLAADRFERNHLSLTRLSSNIQDQLQALQPQAGNIYTNPIDTTALFYQTGGFRKTMEILDKWDEIDIILLHVPYDILAFLKPESMEGVVKRMIGELKDIEKPLAMLLHFTALEQSYSLSLRDRQGCLDAKVPVFLSIESCARALDSFIGYFERRRK